MTKKMTLRELGLSLGFKEVPEDDPLYSSGWIISANPWSIVPENQFEGRESSPSSPSAPSKKRSKKRSETHD